MNRKIFILLVLVIMSLAVCVGCGSSEEANEPEFVAADYIKNAEFVVEENGIAFWDVYLVDDIDWDALSYDEHNQIAIEAIADCANRDETPDYDHCWVMGYHGPDKNLAFSWSPDHVNKVLMYHADQSADYEYELVAEDYEKIDQGK